MKLHDLFEGIRCLMMPYIQGDRQSVPQHICDSYGDIIEQMVLQRGEVGYLTIDESMTEGGKPHRGARAKYGRALHTEAGIKYNACGWGVPSWGSSYAVTLDRGVQVLIANNIDNSCAVWDYLVNSDD